MQGLGNSLDSSPASRPLSWPTIQTIPCTIIQPPHLPTIPPTPVAPTPTAPHSGQLVPRHPLPHLQHRRSCGQALPPLQTAPHPAGVADLLPLQGCLLSCFFLCGTLWGASVGDVPADAGAGVKQRVGAAECVGVVGRLGGRVGGCVNSEVVAAASDHPTAGTYTHPQPQTQPQPPTQCADNAGT